MSCNHSTAYPALSYGGAGSIIVGYYYYSLNAIRFKVPVMLVGMEKAGVYANELNFPCGKCDSTDCCAVGSAIRETSEEIAVDITPNIVSCIAVGNTLMAVTRLAVGLSRTTIDSELNRRSAANVQWCYQEMSRSDYIVIGTGEPIDEYLHRQDPGASNVSKFVVRVCGLLKNDKSILEPILGKDFKFHASRM